MQGAIEEGRLRRLLSSVKRPSRYIGGEWGSGPVKEGEDLVRICYAFPDLYEVGMSYLGFQILYPLTKSLPYADAERVYTPWPDMEAAMRDSGTPIWALESKRPLTDFDAVGFTLQYELSYTNILTILDLAGIPFRSAERGEEHPLILAGGIGALAPEPVAPFIDAFMVGDGEVLIPEVLKCLHGLKGAKRAEKLAALAAIEGVYVPALYDGSKKIRRRIAEDLDGAFYHTSMIVPNTGIVHDRVAVQVFKGCTRGCRFCQAGYVYRPIRARSAERVIEIGKESLKNTGCQEATLLSLSSSDYKHLTEACDGLLDWCEPQNISLSLPSLRADNFSMELMSRLQKVRRGGLTFAPEAGTQRLRDVINKNVTEDDLLNTCRIAFEGGWNGIKLYFMLGLPTETDEDVRGIADLASKVLHVWRQYSPNKQRGVRITVSTSCFIPKPHSPFQWEAQVSMEEYRRRVELLRSSITAKNVSYNWHDPDTSFVEAALSRGDRKIADVIEAVWRAGGRMEAWSDYFRFERWMRAFEDCGLDPAFYASRERGEDEVLPWCRVNMGVRESLLLRERHRAYEAQLSPDCRAACSACGAAALLEEGRCDG